jgi:hypothetical protein
MARHFEVWTLNFEPVGALAVLVFRASESLDGSVRHIEA